MTRSALFSILLGTCACGGVQAQGETIAARVAEPPVQPPAPGRPAHAVEALWVGPSATCIKRGGEVLCAGTNTSGKFHTSERSEGVMTGSDVFRRGVVDMSVGSSTACALYPDGAVECAGSMLWGERGDGCRLGENAEIICDGQEVDRSQLKPVSRVEPLPRARQIEGGANTTCALTRGGEVYCWGSNIEGELGVGDRDHSTRPLWVEVSRAQRIYAGDHHSCALTDRLQVWCWGNYRIDESENPYGRAVLPGRFVSMGEPESADDVIVTRYGVCVTSGDRRTRCVGEIEVEEAPPVVAEDPLVFEGVLDIVSGVEHTCVLTESRAVSCYSSWPHLAGVAASAGDFDSRWREVVLPYEARVARLVAHRYSTCAVSELGEVACWGARAEVFGIPPLDDEGAVPSPTLLK